jgi:type IV pilus assembly protein PilC
MPYFLCHVATDNGHNLTRSFLAPTAEDCRKHFESEGLCVLSVRKDWKKLSVPGLPFQNKIKDRDFIMFNQELMALLRAGYPVLKSLELITARTKNLFLKEMLLKVESEIRSGKALSDAFAPFEKSFSTVYTASLMAGEQSGNLPGTIARFIDYARVIAQTKSKIRTALTYPTLLLTFSLVMIGIIINFVLPRFSGFYKDFEAQLPGITLLLMGFAALLRRLTPYLLVLAAAGVLVLFRLRNNEKVILAIDRLKLRLPFFKTILQETGIALFSRTLGLLLEAGITLLTSLPIASQAIPNKYFVNQIKHLPDDIRNGGTLSDSLVKAGLFPMLAVDMVRIGETSANLHGMLKEIAEVYDQKTQARIDIFVSLIEPVMIVFMGLMVGAMLLAVYLPIFNIIKMTR